MQTQRKPVVALASVIWLNPFQSQIKNQHGKKVPASETIQHSREHLGLGLCTEAASSPFRALSFRTLRKNEGERALLLTGSTIIKTSSVQFMIHEMQVLGFNIIPTGDHYRKPLNKACCF